MSDLGLNKILGAGLATALGLMALSQLSGIVYGSGGHGGGHDEDTRSYDEIAAERYAYYVSTGAGSDGPVVEEVFDLGLLLASADALKGERTMKAKCATCHTWNEGGADGTGPHLYGIMGKDIASIPGFSYSSGLEALEGNWTYEEMDAWLENPGTHVPGTKMAFAGLRKTPERMNMLAFLASVSPDGPAFPDPLPAVEEAALEDEEAVDATVEETAAEDPGIEIVVPAEAEIAPDAAGEAAEAVVDAANDAADTAADIADDVAESVTDAVETVVDEATGGEE